MLSVSHLNMLDTWLHFLQHRPGTAPLERQPYLRVRNLADATATYDAMFASFSAAVERLGVYFKRRHGLDFRCLRFPLVVSPDAPPGAVDGH